MDLQRLTARSEALEFFASSNRQHSLDALACANLSTLFTKQFLHYHRYRHTPLCVHLTASNQNIISILAENPHYAARLRSVFGSDIAGPLARWLLRPSTVHVMCPPA